MVRLVGILFGIDLELGVWRCVSISRKTVSCSFVRCLAWLLMCCCFHAGAQTNEWTWMGGVQYLSLAGVYGTKGVASPGNLPGYRSSSASWTDAQGNLWMFGGSGNDSAGKQGCLSDLWSFSPISNEWTWMGGSNTAATGTQSGVYGTQGTPDSASYPACRSNAVTWTDAQGRFWLFGGIGPGSDEWLNDLWEFDPKTNEWIWMGGVNGQTCTKCSLPGIYGTKGSAEAANFPGGRSPAAGWVDGSGNLWLFGGSGLDSAGNSGSLNDLWSFSPSTGQWTWVGGNNTIAAAGSGDGVYGTLGTAASSNLPGSRSGAVGWTDQNGKFWLFGGLGFDSVGTQGLLNDLWRYDPASALWTWMGGSSTYPLSTCGMGSVSCGIAGRYGTLQVPSSGNIPGDRESGAAWTDKNGNLWLFGGQGIDGAGAPGFLNDLWEYSVSTGQWVWMAGGATINCHTTYCSTVGTYGSLQIPSLGDSPSGREYLTNWTDLNGNLWLFGGWGATPVSGATVQYFQDLWEFQPNQSAANVAAAPVFSPAPGTYSGVQSVSISDATPGASISYTINQATPAATYTGPISVAATELIQAIAMAPEYANSNVSTASYTINYPLAPAPTFSLPAGTYSSALTLSVSDSAPNAQIYFTTDGSTPTTGSTLYSGPVQINATETVNAIAVATGYAQSPEASALYIISTLAAGPGAWVWLGGTPGPALSAVYGTLQTAAPANSPGGRYGTGVWSDGQGNLWIFGGTANRYNDLWKLNLTTREWTWMTGTQKPSQPGIYGTLGTPAAANSPGSRQYPASWTDSKGKLWLFGGDGFDAADSWSNLNDLWVFDPASSQWTWMGGNSTITVPCSYPPGASHSGYCGVAGVYGTLGQASATNYPGSRFNAVTWTDASGNVWLFGGNGRDSQNSPGYLNDLWKYNPATNQWTWIAGNSTLGPSYLAQPGVYGTQGTAAVSNTPGGRWGAVGWTDAAGNLWVFGGHGVDAGGSEGVLNDLWEYSPSNGQWTWMGGQNLLLHSLGRPGNEIAAWMTPSASNMPGGRVDAQGWVDQAGNLWLLGGYWGLWVDFTTRYANDLWEFSPGTGEWTWWGGVDDADASAASYGTFGLPSLLNNPGPRYSSATWADSSGGLWMMGGETGSAGMDDLWMYSINPSSGQAAAAPVFTPGSSGVPSGQQVTITDSSSGAAIFYEIDQNGTSIPYSGPITVTASESISAFAAASGVANSPVSTANYSVPVAQAPVFTPAAGTFATAQTVSITDATPNASIYYSTDGSTPTTQSSLYSGPITISSSQVVQATAIAAGESASPVSTAVYVLWPAGANNEWAWLSGTDLLSPVYGTQGVPGLSNTPGARYVPAQWTDANGNLWLFGGGQGALGSNEELFDDLWEYDPKAHLWTWVSGNQYWNLPGVYGTQGKAGANNFPGSRDGAASWVDSAGHFWLFGGIGNDSAGTGGILNDLWEFDPSTMMWTWVSGSSTVGSAGGQVGVYGALGVAASGNTPGSRYSPAVWVDKNGHFWLFGGYGFDANGAGAGLNDFWEFDPSTNDWTWEGGSNTSCVYGAQSGVWGTMGTAAAGNVPSCRFAPASWTDQQGNFWLFGGEGRDIQGYWGDLSNVWEFNPTTKQWAWMGGTDIIDLPSGVPLGFYGSVGVPAAGNIPAGRRNATQWTDTNGNLWLMGGIATGFEGDSGWSVFNDLWVFFPAANEWAWMGGNINGTGSTGFPTEWTPSSELFPNVRWGAASWMDTVGDFWLYGGEDVGDLNDSWEYSPAAPAPIPDFAVVDLNNQALNNAQSFVIAAGTSGTTTVNTVVSDGFAGGIALSAVNLPSGITATFSPATVSGFATSQVNFTVGLNVAPGNYSITIAGTSGGVTKDTTVSLTVGSAPPATFTLAASAPSMTVNSGGQGTLTFTVTPEYGFSSAVSFACSGLPAGATCTFNPTTITPSASPSTLQLTVSAAAQTSHLRPVWLPGIPGVTCLTLLLFLRKGKRRQWRSLLLVSPILIVLGVLAGCGSGGGGGSGTGGGGGSGSPTTTTVTVTATSSTVVQSTTFSLTVN
jgi:N-acetylneuraminic acid mutarotase